VAAAERESDLDYLLAIESLAQEVVDQAAAEDWLTFGDQGQKATVSLRRAINELATRLRIVHFDGDGCLEHLDAQDAETQ
jgi:hypothetical protein